LPRKRILMNKIESTKTLKEGFNEFITYCKAKNLSEQTIKYYEYSYRLFTKFYNENHLIKDITLNTIQNYIIFLKENFSENDITLQTNQKGIRVILHYFMDLGYMPKFKIPLIKAEKKVIDTYTDNEIEILLKKPDINKCSFKEYRNWVIVNFLYGTGCRAGTLCELRINDLDFENMLIRYRKTKNRKQQLIPMPLKLKKILLEYLQYRQAEKDDDYLFPNTYGGKLTTDLLQHDLAKYNKSRGVTKLGVHRWRHTFAKKWLLGGGDIVTLQTILGHRDIEMTRNYINMFAIEIQDNFKTYNPLDKFNHKEKIKLKKGSKQT